MRRSARRAANPETAMAWLERLLDMRPALADKPQALNALAYIFSGSFLGEWLIARPEEIDWFVDAFDLSGPRGAADMRANISELMERFDIMPALRRFRNRELCCVCAMELGGLAGLEETMRQWSLAGDIAIDMAIGHAIAEAGERYGVPEYLDNEDTRGKSSGFCAIALGKLGGQELNISSDVDLVFVHLSDSGMTSGPKSISLHEYFTFLARRTTQLLNEVTEDGFVFRVDLELRPEGECGEITNSVGAMEIYYESWGRQWERQALLKARHCGGDESVSKEVLDRLKPFVYRKYLDEGALMEMAVMKEKIDKSLVRKKSAPARTGNIKLGKGGIREIEFVAQALQMLYGARYTDLQTRSTIGALDICESLGLLSAPHHADLKESYIFYRELENRLQYAHNRQTHTIPAGREEQNSIGRLMGLMTENPGATLISQTNARRERVRKIFDLFFFIGKKPDGESFPAPLDDEEAITGWLDSLRFDHPKASARALNLLAYGSSFSHASEKSSRLFDSFGPRLVFEAASTAWPDHVILGFSNFVEVRGGRDSLYAMFDSNRPVIKLLSAIFSSSAHLTSVLLRQPDMLDRMLVADPVGARADRISYAREFDAALMASNGDEPYTKLRGINGFRTSESLRLGLRKILGLCDRFELMTGLTMLAEEYLKAIARLAMQTVDPQGEYAGAKWAIIVGGKLGRREMNFGSDIDMLVFYDENGGDQADLADYVTRLTRLVIKLSGVMTDYGAGYQLDMRLRPEGESGPLVVSFGAMTDYYKHRGRAWERLALVGARFITGDAEFGGKVKACLSSFVTGAPPGICEVGQIMEIRELIAAERVKPGAVDIKFGRGGLIEIEFIVQWLAMERPGETYEGSGPYTYNALRSAMKNGLLESGPARELKKAYLFYRALEDTMRMDREQAVTVIPKSDSALLRRLARAAPTARGGPGVIIERVKQTMSMVREIYVSFFRSRGAKDSGMGS